MEFFFNNIWTFLFMILLILASGTFSGSETAFFNISSRKALTFRRSKNNLEYIAGSLLLEPKKLLTSLLLGNMIVNVCYFSLVSSFLVKNSEKLGPTFIASLTVVFFFMLLLFGEMLPKSLAFKNSGLICMSVALPCYFCVKILYPIQHTFSVLIIEPILRLSGWSGKKSEDISLNQLKELIESTRETGAITSHENRVLTRIVEMNVLKVRHIIKPRVDMVFCEISTSGTEAVNLLRSSDVSYTAVYEKDIDNVKGVVYLRDIACRADKNISEVVKAIPFVPEQKSVESTLVFFQKNNISQAFAVDEYGGIVGIVEMEDITELLFSETSGESEASIEKLGSLRYRLPGDMSIAEWAQAFGITSEQTRFTTIAGLVIAAIDKAPSPGDTVSIKNLKLTVENVEDNRIKSVILTLEQQE